MVTEGPGPQVLYRKWRPQRFAEVVGQEPVTRTLRNAIASGRVSHAYLLCGPRGTGKTSLGRLIAKAVNCQAPEDGEPCNRCPSCQEYLLGQAPDLVEMDAASNRGIDEIRRLRDRVGLAPMGGRYKVYLIDEVHMLTQEAYNALLKTLEEPPPHVIFVLATTEPHRLPATIVSRCQRFDLRRIPLQAAVERLAHLCQAEGYAIDRRGLELVARASGGSLRDAINLLEQVVAYYGPSPSPDQVMDALGLRADPRGHQLAAAIARGDLSAALRAVAAARDDGVEMRQLAREAVAHLRALLLIRSGVADSLDMAQEELAELESLARAASEDRLVRALKALAAADFRDDPHSPLPLELALLEALGGPAPHADPPARAEQVSLPVVPPQPVQQQEATGPPSSDEGGDLHQRLVALCRRVNLALADLLQNARVTAVGQEELVLAFPFQRLAQHIDQPMYREVLERIAAEALGRSVQVRLEVATPQRRNRGGHLVQEALRHGAVPLDQEGGSDDAATTTT
ncbi:MAG TPA: DNA polymerase III subunit gamma/tau [Dehalococcoidia bacterium]|nr:DNA polymerase III subunit gamma/tau [Dehalococcoidia bacterium]